MTSTSFNLRTADDLRGRRVLVAGAMGKTGRAMMALLGRCEAIVYGTDINAEGELPAGVTDLRPSEDPAVLDQHAIEVVCVAPGVPLSRSLFIEAGRRGIPVIGDLDLGMLFLLSRPARPVLIALSGTDGKTTTTALIGHLLREAGMSALECGNYGLPFSALHSLESLPSVLVCECSSFQLEDLHFFRPDGALVINIAPDHMDRYPSYAAYLAAKLNIFSLQGEGDVSVIGEVVFEAAHREGLSDVIDRAARPGIVSRRVDSRAIDEEQVSFDGESLFWKEFGADSRTNRMNACAALSLLDAMIEQGRGAFAGNSRELHHRILLGLKSFRGLPHRQERVLTKEGVLYVNDSKATTVHAALSAVASFPGKKVFLLLGGLDKNADFTPFRETEAIRLYPFGRAAEKIAAQTGVTRHFASLEDAFHEAVRDARRNTSFFAGETVPDCVVLLSPACASQDAYRNYEERGQHFRRLALA